MGRNEKTLSFHDLSVHSKTFSGILFKKAEQGGSAVKEIRKINKYINL